MKLIPSNLWLFNVQRLRILAYLYKCQEKNICACDIWQALNIRKNLLSYHMSILIKNGIIKEASCGRKKVYKIVPHKKDLVKNALKITKLL